MIDLSLSLRRIIKETPFVLGVLGGCFLTWWRGRAFVPMAWPAGFDWERYLRETWAYVNPGTMVSTWLEPLYPWLLSTIGETLGWAWAGSIISSVAFVGMVIGAGLIGRALGDSWSGGAAAMALPLTPQLVEGARWVNMYPLLAAGTAVGLGGAIAFARWPKWPWLVVAGLGTGLAWGVDTRTITLIPGVVLLVLLGLQGVQGWGRRACFFLLFGAGLGFGPWSQNHLRVIEREAAADVAVILRGIELTKIEQGPNRLLRSACQGERAVLIHPAGLLTPCAAALGDDNAQRLRENLPFGLLLSLLALPLACLPGMGGRRRWFIALLAIVPPLASTWAMSRWIILTPRYLMQIAPLAAALIPVALVQIPRTLLWRAWAPWVGAAACVASVFWMFDTGPAHRGVREPLERSSTYQMMRPVMESLRGFIDSGVPVLDCSQSHVAVSLLPEVLHGGEQNHEGKDWARCGQWILNPNRKEPAAVITGTRSRVWGVDPDQLPPPWTLFLKSDGMGQRVNVWIRE
jgi:hypothetical protein